MWTTVDGINMTFNEYLISESIKPKFTEFGTDLENGKWKKINDNYFITFFKAKHLTTIYMTIYRNGYIRFYSGDLKNLEKLNDIKTISDVDYYFNMKRTNTSEALTVFNYFFYVINKAIEHFKPKKIRFDGNDKDLGGVYDALVKNSFFIKQVSEMGYQYSGRKSLGSYNFFEFERI